MASRPTEMLSESQMEELALEMEREKYHCIEKAKYIQDQLTNFKTEIDDMKVR